MKTTNRSLGLLILLVAAFGGLGMAQETAPTTTKEMHVKDIRAEQTNEAQYASPLCQETAEMAKRPKDSFNLHWLKVDPATLEPDLEGLMEKSDEVVLVARETSYTVAISPSGNDVAEYFDVKVLRSWKGSHKVGDTLTFAMPGGDLHCRTTAIPDKSWVTFKTITKDGWSGTGALPGNANILFLSQTHGDETPFLPGLRLTGGSGMQGMYSVGAGLDSHTCPGVYSAAPKTCTDFLEASRIPVKFQLYAHDPLIQKYDGMPISSFLQEVQATADSLGYTSSAAATK